MLCYGNFLLGGQAQPAYGFSGVLEHTTALDVHEPEVELCFSIALLGGLAVPAHGFCGVLRDAVAGGVL